MNSTQAQLGWAAGVIDGEGCITTSSQGGKVIGIQVVVVNTDLSMIEKLQELFGGSNMPVRKRPHHCKQQYRWQVVGRKAGKFLCSVGPHLVCKIEQAKLAVEFARSITTKGWPRLPKSVQSRREEISIQMKELKHREAIQ